MRNVAEDFDTGGFQLAHEVGDVEPATVHVHHRKVRLDFGDLRQEILRVAGPALTTSSPVPT